MSLPQTLVNSPRLDCRAELTAAQYTLPRRFRLEWAGTLARHVASATISLEVPPKTTLLEAPHRGKSVPWLFQSQR